MKAYKCNRCGRFFETEWKPQKVRFDDEETKTITGISFIVPGNWTSTPDLCASCMNSFVAWWDLEQENG